MGRIGDMAGPLGSRQAVRGLLASRERRSIRFGSRDCRGGGKNFWPSREQRRRRNWDQATRADRKREMSHHIRQGNRSSLPQPSPARGAPHPEGRNGSSRPGASWPRRPPPLRRRTARVRGQRCSRAFRTYRRSLAEWGSDAAIGALRARIARPHALEHHVLGDAVLRARRRADERARGRALRPDAFTRTRAPPLCAWRSAP